MSGHVSFDLSNEFGKGDKKRGLFTLKSHFCRKDFIILSLCTQPCHERHDISRKSEKH